MVPRRQREVTGAASETRHLRCCEAFGSKSGARSAGVNEKCRVSPGPAEELPSQAHWLAAARMSRRSRALPRQEVDLD